MRFTDSRETIFNVYFYLFHTHIYTYIYAQNNFQHAKVRKNYLAYAIATMIQLKYYAHAISTRCKNYFFLNVLNFPYSFSASAQDNSDYSDSETRAASKGNNLWRRYFSRNCVINLSCKLLKIF